MAYKKPKLNQKVYIIFADEIYYEKVEYIGEEDFLYDDVYHRFYEDYNETWATSFEQAKAILRRKYNIKKLKLEHHTSCGEWWRIANEQEKN